MFKHLPIGIFKWINPKELGLTSINVAVLTVSRIVS